MLILSGVALLVIVVSLLMVIFLSGNKLDLVIGNEPVTEDEFIQVMNKEKYEVTKYFYREYGAEVNKEFWTSSFDGESPYKMLADNTIDTLLHNRANYEIAKENNYIDDVGYEALLERFERENTDRAEKTKNNEPVYGLQEYPLDLFIEYEKDALQKMYINDQSVQGNDISVEDGMAYYDDNKDKSFTKFDDFELEYVTIRYDVEELDEKEVREFEQDLITIYKDLDDGKTLEQIITDEYEYLQPYFYKEKVLSEEVSGKSRELADIFELSKDLKVGESTQVINENEALYLIRCIDRVEYDYLSYDEVKDNIFKSLRESNFEQMIQTKARELEVTSNIEKVYAFTKKETK